MHALSPSRLQTRHSPRSAPGFLGIPQRGCQGPSTPSAPLLEEATCPLHLVPISDIVTFAPNARAAGASPIIRPLLQIFKTCRKQAV
jgi:hypothetical protein